MNLSLSIKFDNLTLVAKKFNLFKRDEKEILKNISGEFRACELTGIVGTSGSGKSSLLNVLSGFKTGNIKGQITINGEPWSESKLRKKFAYIMQDENLHLSLTVKESMNFAIKLKVGNALNEKQQQEKINSILETLNLSNHLHTDAQHLSGGQLRRLSVCVELLDDPKIIFLDESTTGLDSVASTQLLRLLKTLAFEGRTIIATIHTPSALMFDMFDHVYAMAAGNCIYQGSSQNLIPFLKDLDLICPPTYTPSDFLLEIANNDYGLQNAKLVEKIENGKNEFYRKPSASTVNNNNDVSDATFKILPSSSSSSSPPSLIYQIYLLVLRNYKITSRNLNLIKQRIGISIIVALLVGLSYINIGNDGSHTFSNFKYIFVTMFFLLYTSYYSQQTSFPLEFQITKREIFNRHYKPASYYLSLTIFDIPMTILCSFIYLSITYYLTDQPLDRRAVEFFAVGFLTSFVAQGFGLFISSIFKGLKVKVNFFKFNQI